MPDSELLVRMDEGVGQITLNRPQKRNSLHRELLARLQQAVDEMASRADLRLLILAARGPAFCAGMDLGEMQQAAASPDATDIWHADAEAYRNLLAAIFSLKMPTIAVVQGPAIAGGLGLMLACDLVIAVDTATFALPEPKRGLTAAIVTPLLVYRAGAGHASYLLLSGKPINAQDALQRGICQEAVPADRLSAPANELADSVLTGSPLALAAAKTQLRACAPASVLRQLEQAVVASAEARETPDAGEGRRAFLEKRNPDWQPPHRGNWLE